MLERSPAPPASYSNTSLSGKRIIIVLGKLLLLGGAERQALLLGRMLKEQQDADVRVWGLYGGAGRTSDLCEQYGLPWHAPELSPLIIDNSLLQRRRLNQFAALLRQERPDILLPYTTIPNVACGLIWRRTGARLCVWSQRAEGVERVTNATEYLAVSNTPWFIANSDASANFLREGLKAPVGHVRIIHNGVELPSPEATRQEWRQRLNVDDDCLLACMVAHLSIYKDHRTLLLAWRRVVDKMRKVGREAVLLLAGRFVDTHFALKALAFDLNLDRNVRFLGQVDDIAGLLGAVDLAVFSSASEGSPNGVLESMAAGLAVASTDIPAIREAVGAPGIPYLAPVGDATALAKRIGQLLSDDTLRAQLGEANRQRIATAYSPQHMLDQTVSLLSEALMTSATEK